ncbi:MAG: hypothetical protein ACE5FZ_09500, partial [Nitrospiria bacterium]
LPVGEKLYTYPYLVSSHIHLWRQRPFPGARYAGPPHTYPYFYPYGIYPPYYPYWFTPHRPHRHF